MDDKTPDPDLLRKEKTRLRLIGLVVLLLGISGAGLVYWIGTRAEDSRVDDYEQAKQRSESRQLELLYGKSGDFVEGLSNAVKRPDIQAISIAVVATVIAGGCFYLGRPVDEDDETR